MSKNSGFTLVEILVSVALTGMLLVASYSAFQGIVKHQARLGGTIQIQKNLTYINEKMASLIGDGGTLDYEEYFNRRMLGYDPDFDDDDTYTYSAISHYGNGGISTKAPLLQCRDDSTLPLGCLEPKHLFVDQATYSTRVPLPNGNQPYGQYEALGFVKRNKNDYLLPIPLPPIIIDPQLQLDGLPELYLIKKLMDGSYERTFFRHVFVPEDPTMTCDPFTVEGCLGKIQMTKLTSCDIDDDGRIDLWIPHGDFDSSGNGGSNCPMSPPSLYSTLTDNLVWADLTTPDISVVSARFLPAPLKIPQMMSPAGETALSPTVAIRLEIRLSDLSARKYFIPSEDNITKILLATYQLDDE